MKRISLFVVFALLLSFSVSGEVFEVDVSMREGNVSYVFESVDAVSVNVDSEELIVMRGSDGVDRVVRDHKVGLFLQDSVGLVGADEFWTKNNESYVGVNQSVCIIDTGVDFTHDALGSEFGVVVVGGKRFLGGDVVDCAVNSSACLDDHGHGTHVAGIVKAMSPGASIVAVKVLDSDGDGFSSDVAKGVDYCISVADDFNITVISMSLGAPCFDEFGVPTGLCHSDYCDSSYPSYTDLINEASSKNISVVVATGNSALSDAVSSPSCIESAYRVGSSSKFDVLSWFTNAWSNDMFLAPGQSINSTHLNNEYVVRSGTSMATPHFSAALVLLKDYYGLNTNDVFLKNKISEEGVIIYDSSLDMNFTRLNLLYNGEEPITPEEPEPEPEPEPGLEEPIILPDEEPEPEPEPAPVKRGGGGGGHAVTIFEEEELVIDPVFLSFSEVGGYVSSLKSGDLLFMGDTSVFSKYLVPKKWKHTVIYLGPEFELRNNFGSNSEVYLAVKDYYVTNDEILVIDSSHLGVSVRDIREFGYHEFAAFRPVQSQERNEEMLSYAVSQIGKDYDFLFSAKDEAFYCSELLFKSLNEVGFELESSKFVWFNEVILPTDLAAQLSERDDFFFLFYVAKSEGVLVEKEEADLFDGPEKPVLNEFKILFLERGLLSYVVWALALWITYSVFLKSKNKKSRRGKMRR